MPPGPRASAGLEKTGFRKWILSGAGRFANFWFMGKMGPGEDGSGGNIDSGFL